MVHPRTPGKPARLVWLDDPSRRRIVEEHHGLPGEVTSSPGTRPLLLVTRDSLRRLDDWITEDALQRQETPPSRSTSPASAPT